MYHLDRYCFNFYLMCIYHEYIMQLDNKYVYRMYYKCVCGLLDYSSSEDSLSGDDDDLFRGSGHTKSLQSGGQKSYILS